MKIKSVLVHGKTRWRCSYSVSGKNARRYFDAESAAKLFAADLKTEQRELGQGWRGLSANERLELFAAWQRSRKKGYSLADACQAYEQSGAALSKLATVGEAAADFKVAKEGEGLSREYTRILLSTVTRFCESRADRQLTSIDAAELRRFLADQGWGKERTRVATGDLKLFFNWCQAEGLIKTSPADNIKRPKILRQTKALEVPQVVRLLNLARSGFPELVPWLAMSLFAPLRQSELLRLEWEMLRDGMIEIPARIAKTGRRRLIPIQPNLAAWIQGHPAAGLVCSSPRRIIEFRAAAGGLAQNILRDTAISYTVARLGSIGETAIASGNSESIIKEHYHFQVRPTEATAFWALTPDALTLGVSPGASSSPAPASQATQSPLSSSL